MSLTIHVGAHKTATTHLQRTLRGMIPQMLAAGVHYSDVKHWRGGRLRLPAALNDGANLAALRGRLRRRLDVIAETWPEMVISEENLLGNLRREGLMGTGNVIYPQARRRLARLCALLRHRPATICLAVREPSDFLTSAFAMQVKGGHELLFTEYLNGFDPAALSCCDLAQRLLNVRGVARLVVWRYEDYAAVRPRILALMLPGRLTGFAEDPPAAVVGMSQPAYARVLEQAIGQPDADVGQIARDAIAAFPRGPDAPRLNLADAATAAACRAAYAADLDRIAALPRTTLLRPAPR